MNFSDTNNIGSRKTASVAADNFSKIDKLSIGSTKATAETLPLSVQKSGCLSFGTPVVEKKHARTPAGVSEKN